MRSRLANAAWIMVLALASISASGAAAPANPAELADINRASVAELLRVPGMTRVWAERIVRFRPYRTKLDLVEQGVVSPEVYQRIRDGVVAHRATAGNAASQKLR
jgi:DNA uptake protein ComE-like DNA-binding protein